MPEAKKYGVRGKPVTIRGTTYDNPRAAAEALGVTMGAIHSARRRDALDRVGVPGRFFTGPRPGRAPKPIVIDGVTYETARVAAEKLGVSHKRAYALADKYKPGKSE